MPKTNPCISWRPALKFIIQSHFLPKPIFILYSRITFNLVKTGGWRPPCSFRPLNHLGVGIGSLLLSKGGYNVHEAPVVLDAALSTASLLFLLLLLVNLDNATKRHQCYVQHIQNMYKEFLHIQSLSCCYTL